MHNYFLVVIGLWGSCGGWSACATATSPTLEGTTTEWVQPAAGELPVWGHPDGLRVGIAPTKGPRGLLRLYAPYLGQEGETMLNFFALEPTVAGQTERGFSELEPSATDGKPGKVFTSGSTPPSGPFQPETPVAPGQVETIDGAAALTVYVRSEPFNSGAEVYLRIRFYAQRPYEVELAAFAAEDSAPLEQLIVTATMGNYARLRELHLSDTVLHSGAIWPDYTGNHFTDHHRVRLASMPQDSIGARYFVAAPDEADPSGATYAPGTHKHWYYAGKKATQYWKMTAPGPETEGLVNGRYVYWASRRPIPGGISFENFEIKRPFRQGATYVYGVVPTAAGTWLQKLQP